MRKAIFWLTGSAMLLVAVLTSGTGRYGFTPYETVDSIIIKGKIGRLNAPKQLWIYIGGEKWDTIPVKDGYFEYRKKMQLPARGGIMVRYKPYTPGDVFFSEHDLVTLFVEAGEMYIESQADSISTASFSGSAADNQNVYLTKRKQDLEEQRRRVRNIDQVIPFMGEMPNGEIFDSESLSGKIFLIDFWGSWCGWCRKGNPHLKELYAKYKDRGFEIIGIGQEWGTREDRSRVAKWKQFKQAIAEDELPWPQILNDPDTRDLTVEYAVTGYPTKLLVDREGKIVLRVTSDHRERKLDAKLEELFR